MHKDFIMFITDEIAKEYENKIEKCTCSDPECKLVIVDVYDGKNVIYVDFKTKNRK